MIVFAWSGFPQYAARCVGAFAESLNGRKNVMVVATRPRVPVVGMEKLCGCPVKWIEGKSWDVESYGQIEHLFVSGWGIPAFNELRDHVRANGGKVYAMVDNNLGVGFSCRFRELVKAARFRLKFRSRYDGFFVPGKSGARLLKFYGVPESRIKVGLYSADASLFKSIKPIVERPKRILYVGQICERKNVASLVKTFFGLAGKTEVGDWRLELYGCGPQEGAIRELISKCQTTATLPQPMVSLHPFQQPEKLAEIYGASRIFILPSKEEHWGLVLHEAALSGCVLLASNQVGSAEDLIAADNGRMFDANSAVELSAALKWAMGLNNKEMDRASRTSVEMAKSASLDRFVNSVTEFVDSEVS